LVGTFKECRCNGQDLTALRNKLRSLVSTHASKSATINKLRADYANSKKSYDSYNSQKTQKYNQAQAQLAENAKLNNARVSVITHKNEAVRTCGIRVQHYQATKSALATATKNATLEKAKLQSQINQASAAINNYNKQNKAAMKGLASKGTYCAREWGGAREGYCDCKGTVFYGKGDVWTLKAANGKTFCSNNVFGDPLRRVVKECRCIGSLNSDGEAKAINNLQNQYNSQ